MYQWAQNFANRYQQNSFLIYTWPDLNMPSLHGIPFHITMNSSKAVIELVLKKIHRQISQSASSLMGTYTYKSEFKITFPSKDLVSIARLERYFCFKLTHTYGCTSIPCSIRLTRPHRGSIENKPRIAGKMYTVRKHSRVTRRGTVHRNRQKTTVDS